MHPFTTDIKFSQLTPAQWQMLLIQRPDTICQVINLFDAGDAEPLNHLTAAIKKIKIKPIEWNNIIISSPRTISHIIIAAIHGHPALLEALTSNPNNSKLTPTQWQQVITAMPRTISQIVYAATNGHPILIENLTSDPDNINLTSTQWRTIINTEPSAIENIASAAMVNYPELLKALTPHLFQIDLSAHDIARLKEVTADIWTGAIIDNPSLISTIAKNFVLGRQQMPDIISPSLYNLNADNWHAILTNNTSSIRHIASMTIFSSSLPLLLSLPLVTLEIHLDDINLSEKDWKKIINGDPITISMIAQLSSQYPRLLQKLTSSHENIAFSANEWRNILSKNLKTLFFLANAAMNDHPQLLQSLEHAISISEDFLPRDLYVSLLTKHPGTITQLLAACNRYSLNSLHHKTASIAFAIDVHPELIPALTIYLNNANLSPTQWRTIITDIPTTICNIIASENAQLIQALVLHLNAINITPAEWKTIITTAPATIYNITFYAINGYPQLLQALTPHLNAIGLNPTEWKNIITSAPATICIIIIAAIRGHPELLQAFTSNSNNINLTSTQWKNIITTVPHTIDFILTLTHPQLLQALTRHLNAISLNPNVWKNIITTATATIWKIALAAIRGHPELLQALTSNSNNINLTSTQWKNIITTVPQTINIIITIAFAAANDHPALLQTLTSNSNNINLNSTEWHTIINESPSTIGNIAFAASMGHPELLHALTPHLHTTFLSADEWKAIITTEPDTIDNIVSAAEIQCPKLLQSLLSQVPHMQITPGQWEKIFSHSATVGAILLSAHLANKNLLDAATPYLFDSSATIWKNIIRKEPRVVMQLAYSLSQGLITAETQLSLITEELTEQDWLTILTTDGTLLQLAIAYEKGHQELFNAAKDHFGGLSFIDWQNIIAQNAKIISKCIRLAKKHEPSLLNAIISHVQRLSQESLEATLNDIQAHIPKLARYAIKSQRAVLCQVLNQALELESVDRHLTVEQKQQIQTLANNGLFAQSDHREAPGYDYTTI